MNLIRENGKVLDNTQLFEKVCEIAPSLSHRVRADEIDKFIDSRVYGSMCGCNGNGVFELLPIDHEIVQMMQKRAMECTICGGNSHI